MTLAGSTAAPLMMLITLSGSSHAQKGQCSLDVSITIADPVDPTVQLVLGDLFESLALQIDEDNPPPVPGKAYTLRGSGRYQFPNGDRGRLKIDSRRWTSVTGTSDPSRVIVVELTTGP